MALGLPVALHRRLHLPLLVHQLLLFASLFKLTFLLLSAPLIDLPLLLTHVALPVDHLLLLPFALLLCGAVLVELLPLLEFSVAFPISIPLLPLLALPFIRSIQLTLRFPGFAR